MVRSQLAWFDRGGRQTGLLGGPADYSDVELSPDGQRLAVSVLDPAEEMLLAGGVGKFPSDWSPDGRHILYIAGGAAIARSDLFVLPLFGDKKPFPYLETSFTETRGRFSPDGQWIAYASNESGQLEIYVARFPKPGERWRVSAAGGIWPRWRRDGKEIVYLSPDNMLMAATVTAGAAGFEAASTPITLVVNWTAGLRK